MQIKSIVLSALVAATTSAHSRRQTGPRSFGCDAPLPSEAQLSIAAELAEQEAFMSTNATALAERQSQSLVVDVYFHVVASSTAAADGYVSVWLPAPGLVLVLAFN